MAIEALGILSLFAVTIVIGYLGQVIFKKTGISDAVWLLLFGLLVGPLLGLADQALYLLVLPLLSALALLFILFDSGLGMDIQQAVAGFSRSMLLAVVGVAVTMAVVMVVGLAFGLDPLSGLLLGAIVSGTSSVMVTSLTQKMRISEKAKTLFVLESVFNDPFVIVVPIVIIAFIVPAAAAASPGSIVLSAFSVGAVLGFLGAIVWNVLLDRLPDTNYDYIMTLAALFLVYVGAEAFGGSGAIAALAFGLVLGNMKAFAGFLKLKQFFDLKDSTVRAFHGELAFFIRSFFFVYLGLIATINTSSLLLGIVVLAALFAARFITVELGTHGMALSKVDKNALRTVFPKGLAAAVVSQLPAQYGVPGGELIGSVVFVIILGTTLLATVTGRWFSRTSSGPARAEAPVERPLAQESEERGAGKPIRKRGARGSRRTRAAPR